MSSHAPEGRDSEAARLGGARAEFVASLGRKVAEARDLLAAMVDDPTSKLLRDELRRRLHAVGSGARLLRFDAIARSLQEALVVLERAAQAGALRENEVEFVGQTLDDLPALAWSETVPHDVSVHLPDEADDIPAHLPSSVLVVGGEALADALVDEGIARARAFECERTGDLDSALQLARAYAPDVIVIDVDLERATGLVASLLGDPLTETVPIIVVGTFRLTDDAARFIALGVAKSLSKAVSPEAIREACDEVLDAREGRTLRVTLGEPTLEQLADRLADELKRALINSVDRPARSFRVPLGEGTEVLGALWGAIARIQEIVIQRTGGAIQFNGGAPEGSIALAPWLHHELPASDRPVGRGAGADVRLAGRRVVVADDDPGVTWFISDLLRTAGCEVHEALDGRTALEIAFRVQPELIVSDILMPGLDGFALSRAIRRDVALRDTPVILLSWKEDLLQRVRELGASAAAYMRKESDSRAVLARVREVLRPRARIEMRLRGEGEARGRLDGLSPRLLLELVCAIRKDARVSVRDAMFLYEIDIRSGAPRKVTRTASDGSYQSGERALASLLGVGSGRFIVATTNDPIRGDLTGSLSEQLARPIAAARGALAAMTGAATMQVERIAIDDVALGDYLRATPDPARTLIGQLASGTSPRQILLAGDASPALLEDVLADLAARGVIRSIEGQNGVDLLSPSVEGALAVVRGSVPGLPAVPPARSSAPEATGVDRKRAPPAPPSPPSRPPSLQARSALVQGFSTGDAAQTPLPPPFPGARGRNESPANLPGYPGAPASLEDAVMREISDRSPPPGSVRPAGALTPWATAAGERLAGAGEGWSIERTARLPMPVDGAVVRSEPSAPPHEGSTSRPDAEEPHTAAPGVAADPSALAPDTGIVSVDPFPTPAFDLDPFPTPTSASGWPERSHESPQSGHPFGAEPSRRRPRVVGVVIAFAVLCVVAGTVFYAASVDPEALWHPQRTPTATIAASSSPILTAVTPVPLAPAASLGDEPPPGAEMVPGFGFLEALVPAGARVQVDDAAVGVGPRTGSALAPGYHELTVEQAGRKSTQVVEVRTGKTTRVRVALP
jgi:DNA-binding response OmpR family regulator